jgi:hypothetical protein
VRIQEKSHRENHPRSRYSMYSSKSSRGSPKSSLIQISLDTAELPRFRFR